MLLFNIFVSKGEVYLNESTGTGNVVMRKCPFCDELNRDDVIQCRRCGEWLDMVVPKPKKKKDTRIDFKKIWSTYGVVIILMIIILAAFLFKVSHKVVSEKSLKQAANIVSPSAEKPLPEVEPPVVSTPGPAADLIKKAEALCSPDWVCPQEAIDYLTEAIRLEPDNKSAYLLRGGAYYKLKKDNLAVGDYSNAIKLDPDNARTYALRGFAYGALGQYQSAIADFDKAISLKPDKASYYQGRANIYIFSKNTEEACLSFKKACDLGACEQYQKLKQQGRCRE